MTNQIPSNNHSTPTGDPDQSEEHQITVIFRPFANVNSDRQAISKYTKAVSDARKNGDRLGESNALGSLGNAYAAIGDRRQAIQCFTQALDISRETGDRRSEIFRLGNIANAYRELGDPLKAIEYHLQSLSIRIEISYYDDLSEELGDSSASLVRSCWRSRWAFR